ncbi:MAG: hypothetical protein KC417_16610 [Myxococcales bacterium]|nr:hypothetical protein [Myxococcales bacterium]
MSRVKSMPPFLRLLAMCCSVSVLMSFPASRALACGPAFPDIFEVPVDCVETRFYVPAAVFPANLVDNIAMDLVRWGPSGAVDESWVPAVTVMTMTKASATEVPTTLVEVSEERFQLVLTDPTPGKYIVLVEGACQGEPSTFGADIVGRFELLPEAEYPESIGSVSASASRVESRTFDLGVDAECVAQSATATLAVVDVELALDPKTAPWREAFEYAVEVDGTIVRGFAKQAPEEGVDAVLLEVTRACDWEPELEPQFAYELSEGEHSVRILAHVSGMETIASEAVPFVLSCSGAGATHTSGCAVRAVPTHASGCAGGGFGLAILVALAGLRRRRARP